MAVNGIKRLTRPFLFCVFCVIGGQLTAAQQSSFAVQGVWTCYVRYENHSYQFRFGVTPETATTFFASHKLTNTNDETSKGSLGKELDGKIEVKRDAKIYLMRLGPGPIGIQNWRGDFEGTADLNRANYLDMYWTFTGTNEGGGKVSWKEDCYSDNPANGMSTPFPIPSVTSTQKASEKKAPIETATATYNRDEPVATPTPTATPVATELGPGETVRRQVEQSKGQGSACDKKVIATMFGYFSYNPEIDLTKGASQIVLTFDPYVMPSKGSTLGQAIDAYATQGQVGVTPDLNLPNPGIKYLAAKDNPSSLKWTEHTQWLWNLTQPFWSSVSEEPGSIELHISSADGQRSVAYLPIKIKGKPWWWFVPWLWENVLGKPEVGLVLLIFLVTAWRKGMPYALRWAWMHIKHKVA